MVEIRHATKQDLEEILNLYENAREYMHSHGNPGQWVGGYPSKELLENDLQKEQLYVAQDEAGIILAVFVYFVGDEPTYHRIDGSWPDDEPYGVVHRIAVRRGTHGIGSFCVNWAWHQSGQHLRMDTHKNNKAMQGLMRKLGFRYCGVVWMEDGSERIAFQKNS